jgi:N-acylneuraminate cytidylyltransferase
VVAVIPARGGSKSIPRKNVKRLGGHPLLAWSIASARESRLVDVVLVSTDDEEIRRTALEGGAEAPFLRPASLAGDETPDFPVLEHALRWLETARGYPAEVLVQLRPTSPFRPVGLVDQALALLDRHPEADSVRTVTSPAQNPYKMWRLRGRWLQPLLGSLSEELFNAPRQRLPAAFWQTGHLDVIRRRILLDQGSLTGHRVLPFFVDPRYAHDLDTPEQWEYAEWLLAGGRLEVRPPAAAAPLGHA